jgi:hypothetical protein
MIDYMKKGLVYIPELIWKKSKFKFALPFRWEGVEVKELGIGERRSSILLKLCRTIGVAERINGWNDIVLNIGELRNGV